MSKLHLQGPLEGGSAAVAVVQPMPGSPSISTNKNLTIRGLRGQMPFQVGQTGVPQLAQLGQLGQLGLPDERLRASRGWRLSIRCRLPTPPPRGDFGGQVGRDAEKPRVTMVSKKLTDTASPNGSAASSHRQAIDSQAQIDCGSHLAYVANFHLKKSRR